MREMEPCVGRFKSTAINECMSLEPKSIAADKSVGLRNPNSLIRERERSELFNLTVLERD